MSKGMLEQIAFVIDAYRLPDLKVGDVVNIMDVWDGRNDNPLWDKSYSYQLSPYEWLNYRWKIVDEKTQTIIITAIEFI